MVMHRRGLTTRSSRRMLSARAKHGLRVCSPPACRPWPGSGAPSLAYRGAVEAQQRRSDGCQAAAALVCQRQV